MMRTLSCLLLLALFALTGCSTTVFESLPTGATTDCDPAWPGFWRARADANTNADKPQTLEITADCRGIVDEGKTKPLHLTLVTTRGGQYLVGYNDSGEPDCIGNDKTYCGRTLLRYVREDDTLRIYFPDHAKISAAIDSGRIRGFSQPQSEEASKPADQRIYRNFVAGSPSQIARILREHPEFFSDKAALVLERVAAPTAAAAPATAPAPATATPAAAPTPAPADASRDHP